MPEMDGLNSCAVWLSGTYRQRHLVSGEMSVDAVEKVTRAHKTCWGICINRPAEGLAELIGKARHRGTSLVWRRVYGADELCAAIANGELVTIISPRWMTTVVWWAWKRWCWRHPVMVWFPDQFTAWRKRTA